MSIGAVRFVCLEKPASEKFEGTVLTIGCVSDIIALLYNAVTRRAFHG